jgi:hypothetical protein
MTFGSALLTRYKSTCTSGKRALEILTDMIFLYRILHFLSYLSWPLWYVSSFLHYFDFCGIKTVKLHLFPSEVTASNVELSRVYASENFMFPGK